MTQNFAYRRCWGAEILDNGKARFRLWAPNVATLSLESEAGRGLPMSPVEDGWFELETDRIRPGDGYSFRLPDGRTVPDPAARAQIGDVHGPSQLVDPAGYQWRAASWRVRPARVRWRNMARTS